MGTEKRERQKANRQARLEETKKVEQRENLKQRVIAVAAIAALVFGGAFLFFLANQDDSAVDDNTFTPEVSSTTTTEPAEDPSAPPELSAPPPGAVITDAPVPCPAEDGSSERTTQFVEAPPMCIDESAVYQAEIATTRGTFIVELDANEAPATVNNFVVLSRYHFYDGVPFHRIIPGFVVQGGDAVGEPLGTGNPGYRFDDELPVDGYEVGSMAMANSGPNSNGSQFFVITGESGAALPPSYSLFGTVTEGLDVVIDIESTGSETGAPLEETVIESITITQL